MMWVKENWVEKCPENANIENRSRKVKEKSDLKMQILKIGQEKQKNMTWMFKIKKRYYSRRKNGQIYKI